MSAISQQDTSTAYGAIATLLRAARTNDMENRRWNPRFPMFQPVVITMAQDPSHAISAFSRDISLTGMGLLHHNALENGTVQLAIEVGGTKCTLPAEIMWCRAAGDGWFVSGANFLE